jgi:hypothetical protein
MGEWNTFDYLIILGNEQGFCGSGVLVSSMGHFLTARHVIEPSSFALIRRPNTNRLLRIDIETKYLHPVADVAMGKLQPLDWEHKFFSVLSRPCLTGEDVYTSGFIGVDITNRTPELRYRKGYIQAGIQYNIGRGPFPAYELSFEVLRGLSGSPLLTFYHEICIVGILFGSGRSEYIDDIDEDTQTVAPDRVKVTRVINKRVVSFGLATTFTSIKEIEGAENTIRLREP